MTIETNHNKVRLLGNGVTTEFSYDFYLGEHDHLVVVIADADDVATTLSEGTDYTVTPNADNVGGIVTYGGGGTPLPSGWSITLYREVPLLQTTKFKNQGGFHAERHEDAFDYLMMALQQVDEILDRCLKVSITSGESGASLDEDFAGILTACQEARDIAVAAAGLAGTARDDASASAATAATAEDLAERWANEAEDTEVTAGNYSALHHASKANASRLAAAAARDSVVVSVHEETATAAQSTIDISASFTALDIAKPNVQVFINGARLATSAWTRTSDTVITLASALSGGEAIEVYSATAASGGSASVTAHEAAYDHAYLMTAAERTKLTGVEEGAEVNNISDANAATLTSGGNADTLHTHSGGGGGGDFDIAKMWALG